MKNGFTLVELSIVLVIIGLLVGGVLVGQSLIDTANINAQIRQIQQFDIAVSNFKGKYKSIPGDARVFSPVGNNDGFIGQSSATAYTWNGENTYFWKNLSDSGFKVSGKNFSEVLTGGVITKDNIPTASYDKNNGVGATYDRYIIAGNFRTPSAYLEPWGFGGVGVGFRAVTLASIDQKMDDGVYNTGNVTGPASAFIIMGANPCEYNVEANLRETNLRCILKVKILSQAGR